MLFSFLVASAASQSFALRPELSRASTSVARIAELVSKISKPSDGLDALQTANGMVDAILAEGPASDHISSADEDLLKSVITLVTDTIYTSMDSSSEADQNSINKALDAFKVCDENRDSRLAADGDVGAMQAQAAAKQTVLDQLAGAKEAAELANSSQWQALSSHMNMISAPPACMALPARTKPALDVFFEESEYVMWYTAQSAAYAKVRDDFVAAKEALDAAIQAYELQLALRDTQYCDWQREFKDACSSHEACFNRALIQYKKLVKDVKVYQEGRLKVLRAGDVLIHNIKFLIGDEESRDAPPSDESRYDIAYGVAPPLSPCDMSPLEDASWNPVPICVDLPVRVEGAQIAPTEQVGRVPPRIAGVQVALEEPLGGPAIL